MKPWNLTLVILAVIVTTATALRTSALEPHWAWLFPLGGLMALVAAMFEEHF